jgi:hypothetical protein
MPNAGPLVRALSVTSLSTTATIGSGLIAMPTADGSIWPIASPMVIAPLKAYCHGPEQSPESGRDMAGET